MKKMIILVIAGALGTGARYVLGGWVHNLLGSEFPFGTLIVNALGCLSIGFLGTLIDERLLFSPQVRLFLIIGFLGAFTTYSSFAYETWMMTKDGEFVYALVNIFGTLAVCFVCLFVGVLLARLL